MLPSSFHSHAFVWLGSKSCFLCIKVLPSFPGLGDICRPLWILGHLAFQMLMCKWCGFRVTSLSFLPCPLTFSLQTFLCLSQQTVRSSSGCLNQGVKVQVACLEWFQWFYLNLFTVPKSKGGFSPNFWTRSWISTFWSTSSVIALLTQEDFLVSVEIKDTYLHMPSFYCTSFSVVIVITTLPVHGSSHSACCRVSTKMLASVLALLCSHGIPVVGYLDNLLLKAQSVRALSDNISDCPDLCLSSPKTFLPCLLHSV